MEERKSSSDHPFYGVRTYVRVSSYTAVNGQTDRQTDRQRQNEMYQRIEHKLKTKKRRQKQLEEELHYLYQVQQTDK